jgi:hypothetical protein
MSAFAFVRRGARVGICVLALGAADAAAQQAPAQNSTENTGQSAPAATESDSVKPAEATGTQATPPPSGAPTADLPELVVDGEDKKKKKVVKTKQVPSTAPSSSDAQAEASEPPPGVTLGTSAPSDTGTTTFDNSNVRMRTDGSGDANSFARNLPNVQYQNQAGSSGTTGIGGTTAVKTVDTKPEEISISGGRTYENNFILNGISITNITGPQENNSGLTDSTPVLDMVSGGTFGKSSQNIYIPTEFVGQATIIDSNASAEYGQFQGGVVMYDLVAPPTDRYRATISYTRDTSAWANFLLADPVVSTTLAPTRYVKNNLAVSIGAPITPDFSFIAQVSRQEAEATKAKVAQLADREGDDNSDNIFYRFAATLRTDIGKFTLDTSRTDYFQHWERLYSRDMYVDITNEGTATQIKYDTDLAGVRLDDIGLGRVKLTSRAYYNTSENQNHSGGNVWYQRLRQFLNNYDATNHTWNIVWNDNQYNAWCPGVNPTTYTSVNSTVPISCDEGGNGSGLQSQTDFGAIANLNGNVLLGSFKVGGEVKQYEGRRARLEAARVAGGGALYDPVTDKTYQGPNALPGPPTPGGFKCDPLDPWCTPTQVITNYTLYNPYDVSQTLNAVHSYAEVDQTWNWLNIRGGVRLDYDDYFEDVNLAPRAAGTITPFEGLSFTAGASRYYLGETLYYALRAATPNVISYARVYTPGTEAPGTWNNGSNPTFTRYSSGEAMRTPFDDEFTASVAIRDPLLNGQLRLRYLERYGRDQFSTTSCGTNCNVAGNRGIDFYRSSSAEYFKGWSNLDTPFSLNAASISASITRSEQEGSKDSYTLNNDANGDGINETLIAYNRVAYRAEQFSALTGNLDIPVRIGSTLSTVWFDGLVEVNVNAGINLGYEGVAPAGLVGATGSTGVPGCTPSCALYIDKQFGATLKLDVSGQINVTEQAAIQFHVDNITNSRQNVVGTDAAPWTLGRSMWLGSSLRF